MTFLWVVFSAKAQTSKHENAAREYIKSQIENLQIKPEHKFKLNFVYKGPVGEVLRFQQMLNDVPVFNSEIIVNFDNNNQIAFSSNSYDANVDNINTTPVITKEQAISVSNLSLNNTKGKIAFQNCELFVYHQENIPTKLAYRITTQIDNKPGDWEVFVDANTSAVISLKDISLYHNVSNSDKEKRRKQVGMEKNDKIPFFKANNIVSSVSGTGMIFNPDPLSAAHATYAGGYLDNGDANSPELEAARTSVVLPDIDFTGGVYRLKSQYLDIADFESPFNGFFTQATSDFSFTRDNDAFEAVNSFYHLDKSMRYINLTLGIPCLPNNAVLFQFDPSGFDGADNSHFLPSTDQISFGEGGVDDAEDADVVLHEFGHGIHDWLTGGNSSQRTGLGEGCGDYWAQSYSRSLNQWAPGEANYQKVFTWDGNGTWNGRSTGVTATYPQTGSSNTEIHVYGQIWATALMKIYDVIGRTKTDKAFLQGLTLTGSNTNQPQAAVAVRQAAINMNYPCADIQTMTDKFNQAGYNMAAVTTRINCPGNQTVVAGAGNTYSMASFISQTNVISANCSATATQNPAVGTSLAPGTYTVTMTATGGTTCNFQLTVQPALSVDEFVKKNLKLYPNPASTEITVSGDFISGQDIEIYNLLGQKLIQKNLITNEEKIDISSLSSGVYTAKFKGSNTTLKFIKN